MAPFAFLNLRSYSSALALQGFDSKIARTATAWQNQTSILAWRTKQTVNLERFLIWRVTETKPASVIKSGESLSSWGEMGGTIGSPVG